MPAWIAGVRFQPPAAAQSDFRKALQEFADQEQRSKSVEKNLSQLISSSSRLSQEADGSRKQLQRTIPRAEGALNQTQSRP